MIVMKFGGTSVANGKRIANIAEIVKNQSGRKIVVVSALAGVTDKLIDMANRVVDLPTTVVSREVDIFCREMLIQHREAIEYAITDGKILSETLQNVINLLDQLKMALLGVGYLEDLSSKSLDYVMSFGEHLSALIVAGTLNCIGVNSVALTGYEAGILTDSSFGRARPLHSKSKKLVNSKLKPLLNKGVTPVVTGFIAANEEANITTLGRGGSDFTASLLGSYLKAKEVQIWTDVDGILTTDPKIFRDAKLIPELSYVEAMDLAYFGAKVVHPKMIEPAMMVDVPVRVKNTFNPKCSGTVIVRKQKRIEGVIKAVTTAKDVVIVNLQGVGMAETPNIAGRTFSVLGDNNVNVVMISGSSESNLSFIVEKSDSTKAINLLKKEFQNEGIRGIGVMEDVSIITVVGAGMQGTKGVAAKVFDTIAKASVNIIMIAQGSSEVNISFVVRERDTNKVIKALHKRFVK